MKELIELINLAFSVERLIRRIPLSKREKMLTSFRKFAESPTGIRINNVLIFIASLGILIEGFAISMMIYSGLKFTVLGLYVSLVSFIVFAVLSLYIFQLGYRKVMRQDLLTSV